jgi:hypothetical protein
MIMYMNMYMIINMIWQVIAMTMNINMTMRGYVELEPLIFKVRPVL